MCHIEPYASQALASRKGAVKLSDGTDVYGPLTMGDGVLLERWSEALEGHGNAVIREILPRRNLLVRKAASGAG